MSEWVIEAQGLEKTILDGRKWEVNALCGVSFQIKRGEVISIMGIGLRKVDP